MGAVLGLELPELHENRAPVVRMGRMGGCGRVAHIGACGKVAVLVGKDAIEHDEFLAARMGMG